VSVLAGASTSAFDQPGTLGFLVVAGMCVILVFLFRSMTRHLRKVTGTAKAKAPAAGGTGTEATAGTPGAGAQVLASAPEKPDTQNE
jgi:hypothetical protein